MTVSEVELKKCIILMYFYIIHSHDYITIYSQ